MLMQFMIGLFKMVSFVNVRQPSRGEKSIVNLIKNGRHEYRALFLGYLVGIPQGVSFLCKALQVFEVQHDQHASDVCGMLAEEHKIEQEVLCLVLWDQHKLGTQELAESPITE